MLTHDVPPGNQAHSALVIMVKFWTGKCCPAVPENNVFFRRHVSIIHSPFPRRLLFLLLPSTRFLLFFSNVVKQRIDLLPGYGSFAVFFPAVASITCESDPTRKWGEVLHANAVHVPCCPPRWAPVESTPLDPPPPHTSMVAKPFLLVLVESLARRLSFLAWTR